MFQEKFTNVMCWPKWSNFIVSLLLLHEILGNICIAIVCFPGFDVLSVKYTIHLKSLLNRVPCVPTCQKLANISFLRANVPACQRRPPFLTGVPTCQKRANISFLRANVPTCQRRAISQIGVPTCQKRANISFLCGNVPKTCHFPNWRANMPKACQFFNYFSKEKMFQLWLFFANVKNTWAILENLSREVKNLKQIFWHLLVSPMHSTNLFEKAYIM